MKHRFFTLIPAVIVLLLASFIPNLLTPQTAEAAREIYFPVIGPASFSNDYNAPRSNGVHHAIDIFANKMQPLVAAATGTIVHVAYPQPSWGYSITIRDSQGYRYRYIHMNNDKPGTDNGNGGAMNAYAPDMRVGNRVVRGQLIGWVGDSGNAETTAPHVHFEMFNSSGQVVNPYSSLVAARRLKGPVNPPALPDELLPYGNSKIGLNVAMGNFDGGTFLEIVTGAGKGGGPRVKLYNDDNTYLNHTFYAYRSGFTGGVDVAAGDVDNDGIDEIITGAGRGGGPRVKVFKLDGTVLFDEYVYNRTFTGGVRVAAGDIDNDGVDEIITGAGPGGGPRVKAYELDGTIIRDFYAYRVDFPGGVDVAGGDVTGTETDEIITGAGPGGGPRVIVWGPTDNKLGDFYAYFDPFPNGVRVSAGNVRPSTAKEEIMTAPASKGPPRLKLFTYSGSVIRNDVFLEEWWVGNYDSAAGYDTSRAGTGVNRRASVRIGLE